MRSVHTNLVKKKSNWGDISQKHIYGQSTGTDKKWIKCGNFSLSYLSKITQKWAKRSEDKVLLYLYFVEIYLETVCRDS